MLFYTFLPAAEIIMLGNFCKSAYAIHIHLHMHIAYPRQLFVSV